MLRDVLDNLTDAQREALRRYKIERQLIYKWRNGMWPTELQVARLAEVTGASWEELQREATLMRAPEEDRAAIARAIGWSVRNRS